MNRKENSPKAESEPPGPAPNGYTPEARNSSQIRQRKIGGVVRTATEACIQEIDMLSEAQKEKTLKESTAGFEEVDHTADVALRIWAPDFEALLVQAARGAAWIMTGKLPVPPYPVRKHMSLKAFDRESLLVAFLGELAYSAEVDREIFSIFEFERVTDRRLLVLAEGVRVPALKTVIKAVTYHDLEIVETLRGFETTIVFDV